MANIVDIAVGSDDFDILEKALIAADLVSTVQGASDITVFAPTDEAFKTLAEDLGFSGDRSDEDAVFNFIAGALAGLDPNGDPIPLLTEILTYHVGVGAQTNVSGEVTTLQGGTFTANGTELIDNDTNAANPNIGATVQADNGVIQVIDRVLLPIETPVGDSAATQLTAAEDNKTPFSADFDSNDCVDTTGDPIYTEDVWFAAAHDHIKSFIFGDYTGFGGGGYKSVTFTTNVAQFAELLDIDRIVDVDYGNLESDFGVSPKNGPTGDPLRDAVNDGTTLEQSFVGQSYQQYNGYQLDGIDIGWGFANLRAFWESIVEDQDYTLNYLDSHGVLSSLNLKAKTDSAVQELSPIAFDLNGNGEIDTTGDSTTKGHTWNGGAVQNIDLDADGVAETIEWMDGTGDGLLVNLNEIDGLTEDYLHENAAALNTETRTKVIEGVDPVYQVPAGFAEYTPGVYLEYAKIATDGRANNITGNFGTTSFWVDLTAPGVTDIYLSVGVYSEINFFASNPNATELANVQISAEYAGYAVQTTSSVRSDVPVTNLGYSNYSNNFEAELGNGAKAAIQISGYVGLEGYTIQDLTEEVPHFYFPGTPDETITETVFLDANGDTLKSLTIDGEALYGDQGSAFANGYDKLSQLEDDNNDGVVSGAELNNLAVWVDDGDARLEVGEIKTLEELGITEISTQMTTTSDGRMVSETKTGTLEETDLEAAGKVTYSLEGADAAFFQIDEATGELTFVDDFKPDFENPADSDGNNVYDVTVVRTATDLDGELCEPEREPVQVTVEDGPEPICIAISENNPSLSYNFNTHECIYTEDVWFAQAPDGPKTGSILGNSHVTEGNSATYSVKLNEAVTTDTLVTVRINDGTAFQADQSVNEYTFGFYPGSTVNFGVTSGESNLQYYTVDQAHQDQFDAIWFNDAMFGISGSTGVGNASGMVVGVENLKDDFKILDSNGEEVVGKTFQVLVRAGSMTSESFQVVANKEVNGGFYQFNRFATETSEQFGLEIDMIGNHTDVTGEIDITIKDVEANISPLALDLNGDGKIGVTGSSTVKNHDFTEGAQTVEFDLDADGEAETIEWFNGDGDGILVNTDFINGSSIDGRALYGDQGGAYTPMATRSSAQLEDDNNDGVINGAELSNLALWVDDGDAVLEAGELRTLASEGIKAISAEMETTSDGRMVSEAGVDLETTGEVTYSLEGPDAAFFQIDPATGELSYANGFVPDFDNPQDAGGDNIYDIVVVRSVLDSAGDCIKEPLREHVQIKVEDEADQGSISGTYFCDENGNAVRDGGDTPVAGVLVMLLDAGGNATGDQVFTDANGNYSFTGLAAGTYGVKFTDPNNVLDGKELVAANQGGDDSVDSDAIGDTTESTISGITVVGGQDNANNDAGAGTPATLPWAQFRARYFCDGNAVERWRAIRRLRVCIRSGHFTDANGNYSFDDRLAKSVISCPTNNDAGAQCDDAIDSDAFSSGIGRTTDPSRGIRAKCHRC